MLYSRKCPWPQRQVCTAETRLTLNYPFLGSRKIPKPYSETLLTSYISSNLKTFHFIDEESEASKATEKVLRYPGGFMEHFFMPTAEFYSTPSIVSNFLIIHILSYRESFIPKALTREIFLLYSNTESL